jgi:predicted acylesterase/phospholipase RssA
MSETPPANISSGEKKRVFIGSVSGNFFVWQMAAIVKMEREYFKKNQTFVSPQLCMGSSGGSVSLGLAIGCVWNPDHMIDRIKNIDSGDLFKKHDHVFTSSIVSFFRFGTLFRPISNIEDLQEKFLPFPSTMSNVQMIVGTYCTEDQKPRYFSNAIREISSQNIIIVKSHTEFIRSIVASCSIPIILPKVPIGGENFQDGGLYSASPIHDFSQQIMRISGKLQLVYFAARKTMHKTSIPIVSELVNFLNSNYIKDIELAQTILASRLNRTVKNSSGVNMTDLIDFFDSDNEFVAVIYPIPENSNSFNMMEFSGVELSKILDDFNSFHIELYY